MNLFHRTSGSFDESRAAIQMAQYSRRIAVETAACYHKLLDEIRDLPEQQLPSSGQIESD